MGRVPGSIDLGRGCCVHWIPVLFCLQLLQMLILIMDWGSVVCSCKCKSGGFPVGGPGLFLQWDSQIPAGETSAGTFPYLLVGVPGWLVCIGEVRAGRPPGRAQDI